MAEALDVVQHIEYKRGICESKYLFFYVRDSINHLSPLGQLDMKNYERMRTAQSCQSDFARESESTKQLKRSIAMNEQAADELATDLFKMGLAVERYATTIRLIKAIPEPNLKRDRKWLFRK